MASSYPSGLDNLSTSHQDNVNETIHAATVNDLADAVNKIEAELGTLPKGSSADVKTRLGLIQPLTGAAAATRYVGGTTSGSPVSGTFAVGDYVVTQDGHIYICTTAGTPGTWTQISGGGGGSSGGQESLYTIATSGASQTLNIANGATQDITLTANCTFTFTSPAAGSAWYMTLLLRQDATGTRTVTWPAITWLGSGIAPILQTAANAADSVVVFTVDGGSNWFGVAQTSASGLKAGSSFPGSPSDGDLFYRSDRRVLYEYNSTATRWLSVERKYVAFAPGSILPANQSTTGAGIGYVPVFEDIYIESWVLTSLIATTNDGSKYWTYSLYKESGSGASTLIASQDTHLDTHDAYTSHTISVGSVISASTYQMIDVVAAKTSTPGNFYVSNMLVVRSAG